MFRATHRPSSEAKTAQAASGLPMWKFVGRVVAGSCQAEPDSVQAPDDRLCRPKHVELHINME